MIIYWRVHKNFVFAKVSELLQLSRFQKKKLRNVWWLHIYVHILNTEKVISIILLIL